MLKMMLPVDGSAPSNRAVDFAMRKRDWYKDPFELHLINVQPPMPYGSAVTSVMGHDTVNQYHKDEAMKVLTPIMKKLDAAAVPYKHHICVGEPGEVIPEFAKAQGCDQIIMGTRGQWYDREPAAGLRCDKSDPCERAARTAREIREATEDRFRSEVVDLTASPAARRAAGAEMRSEERSVATFRHDGGRTQQACARARRRGDPVLARCARGPRQSGSGLGVRRGRRPAHPLLQRTGRLCHGAGDPAAGADCHARAGTPARGGASRSSGLAACGRRRLRRALSRSTMSVLRRWAVDAILWSCAPAIFLFVYVTRYRMSAEAVGPHLRLVGLAFLALCILRITLRAWLPGRTAPRIAMAFVTSALLATLLAYYGLVLIGLESWGRVISWDLIRTYAGQAATLADIVGMSLYLIVAMLLAAYLALFASAWWYLGKLDWTLPLARAAPRWALPLCVAAGSGICAIEVYDFIAAPAVHRSEPVGLTFFPLQGALDLQGYALDSTRAERQDRLEDAARANYAINPSANRKNVVLIVVDALRPDHMGVYGYRRDTTPNLSRLSNTGVVRKLPEVRASCSASLCGLLSLLGSRYVHELSNRPFTLQQALKAHGYSIRLILGGDHANFYGLKAVYGAVDSYFDASEVRSRYPNDDQVALDATARLPAWDGVPVMMQFHLMSAHALGTRHPEHLRYTPYANYAVMADVRNARESAVNYYDNGVLQADAVIAELLRQLGAKGYLRDTLVVITADHGESLGERGVYAHANSVDEEVLRIPLLLIALGYSAPALPPANTLAAQVDIAPTILAELGMPAPRTWSGSPLQREQGARYLYFQDRYAAGLIDPADPGAVWKYWRDNKTGKEHAANLSLDRAARHNAIDAAPAERRREWRRQYLQVLSAGTGAFEHAEPAAPHLRRAQEPVR